MRVSATMRSAMMRALRVLLVFTLVFWSTFRIEMVAFAEGTGESQAAEDLTGTGAGSSTGENQGNNEGLGGESGGSGGTDDTSGEGGGDDGGKTGGTDDAGTTGGGDDGGSNTTDTPKQEDKVTTFKNLEVHLLNENPPADSTDPLKHVGAYVYDYERSAQMAQLQIGAVQGELTFVPVIVRTDGTKIDASDLVEWSVSSHPEIADFTDAGGKKSSVLKASGAGDNEVGVVCTLKSDAYSQFNLDSNANVKVEFTVGVIEQAGSYVESVELLDENGNVLTATDTLKLDYEEGKPLSYQFSARLRISDPAKQGSDAKHTITTKDSDLSERDKELIESLAWSVADAEDASIDETGLFKATAKLETTVVCSTPKGHGGASVSASTTVNTGLDIDVQGASHPQDTLLVIAPSEVVKTTDSAQGKPSGESADAAQTSGDSSKSPDAANPAEAGTAGDEAEQAGSGPEGEAAMPDPVSRPYSLDELSSLGWSTVTYTFQGSTAGSSQASTIITGAGPSLVAILEDAGVDLSKVASVTFVNYQGESQTISWSSMGGADSGAVLAANSLVHVEGEGAPADESGLLKNTRFRLMVADGVSIDSALPWINTIRVNGEGTGDGGGNGTTDSSLRAVIGYIPVGMGSTAILSASVVGLYQGEQFGYEWQESNDGGVTWSDTIDTAQTLRVPTSESTIGRMYRVIATTNNGRKAESDPVTISENTGFSVALAYDPPLAGEVAFFTTSVTGVEPADITDYIWEWTEDGGDTWQEIAGSRGNPTFSARTDPIEDTTGGKSDEEGSGTGEEGEGASSGGSDSPDQEIDKTPAPSMWVHVRVLATGGREAVSNPVMLTVHVVDDGGSGQVPTEDIPDKLPDEPTVPGSDDPTTVTPPEKDSERPGSAAEPDTVTESPVETGPVIQEVTSITTESAPRSESTSHYVSSEPAATEQTPDGTETTPNPETAASEAPTELIVNPQVTAEILEQQEAVNAAVQATRPGARWTALTTVDPDGKDIQRILNDNPFVPFTAPFALGITAAGFVEKLLGFRRQVR